MNLISLATMLAGMVLAPLLLGVINRTKASFAGRHGVPLLQAYYDLAKLFRKGAVYSRTTTWIFQASPIIGLACVVTTLFLLPVHSQTALLSFSGDLILFAYCLGTMRFFMVIAALDTGSAFEGMGASREVQFSALAEPALLIAMATLARITGSLSLSGIFAGIPEATWGVSGPALALVAAALFVVMLAENARIPVDDPNTHLELTMIHEVLVLDYSGPDLGMILYGSALKLWVLGALIVNTITSMMGLGSGAALAGFVGGMILLAILVGIVESIMARLSLLKVPQLLIGATAVATLAFVLIVRIFA